MVHPSWVAMRASASGWGSVSPRSMRERCDAEIPAAFANRRSPWPLVSRRFRILGPSAFMEETIRNDAQGCKRTR